MPFFGPEVNLLDSVPLAHFPAIRQTKLLSRISWIQEFVVVSQNTPKISFIWFPKKINEIKIFNSLKVEIAGKLNVSISLPTKFEYALK